jgi:hypothetical protein
VADLINRNFEAAWESVRPVPLVRIDFGNQTVVTRTLHGNIATYVCNADGQVLDILPGIYTPSVYLDRLYQFSLLAQYAGMGGTPLRAARVHEYHKSQAEVLKKNQSPLVFVKQGSDFSKRGIEIRLKAVLATAGGANKPESQTKTAEVPKLDSAEEVAHWQALVEDTQNNETSRRLQIHEMLAKAGMVHPQSVTKWLYKAVLHADLDDPYLGLASVLFANYPFKDRTH